MIAQRSLSSLAPRVPLPPVGSPLWKSEKKDGSGSPLPSSSSSSLSSSVVPLLLPPPPVSPRKGGDKGGEAHGKVGKSDGAHGKADKSGEAKHRKEDGSGSDAAAALLTEPSPPNPPPPPRPSQPLRPCDLARGGALASSSSGAEAAGPSAAAVGSAVGPAARRAADSVRSQSPYEKRRMAIAVVIILLALFAASFASLYAFHRGFRRTVQFWSGMGPIVAEYRIMRFRARRIDRVDDDEYKRRARRFNECAAPRIVNLIQSMGGIYIKLGQVMSTIGQGLLPEEYTRALRPLQDGVPPRDIGEISTIIERSTGKRMDDLFLHFEERPVGSASIAQAHRATLRPPTDGADASGGVGEEVVVKVQYPEVAELFDADLNNLEVVTRLFMPENTELVKALRERHENELDFTIEADNLREVAENMRDAGVEPSLVRIPRVRNETGACTRHVLIMEYLEGTSLADAIEREQDRVAAALGREDAKELRTALAERMREHFERGGGAGSGGMGEMLGGGGSGDGGRIRLAQALGPAAAGALRFYARMRERAEAVAVGVHNTGANAVRILSGGSVEPRLKSGPRSRRKGKRADVAHVNLGRVLKTLIRVHGIQMLRDGVYNADPHPGNVLVLPDGRLGLLDYGMVGRLSDEDRRTVARTVLALSRRDKTEAARLYRDGGYRATWRGDPISDDGILHRFATFHLDKIDLSPIPLDDGERMDAIKLLRSVHERVVPEWVEQARRLGGLLMGVSAQAARPVSLSREWEPIARKALEEGEGKKGGGRRIK